MRDFLRRDFLGWVIARREQTKEAARRRLHSALMRDRLDVSPDLMFALRQDVRSVLSRYMVVGDDFQEFEIQRMDESLYLVSNIRVEELPRWAPVGS